MGQLIGKHKHTAKVGNHPHTNVISKPIMVRRGEYKCRILEMYWKLRDEQLKTLYMYIYIYTYIYIYIYDCYIKTLWKLQMKNLQQIHSQKRKSNPNTTLQSSKHEKRKKEEGKKKDLQKTNSKELTKWQEEHRY